MSDDIIDSLKEEKQLVVEMQKTFGEMSDTHLILLQRIMLREVIRRNNPALIDAIEKTGIDIADELKKRANEFLKSF